MNVNVYVPYPDVAFHVSFGVLDASAESTYYVLFCFCVGVWGEVLYYTLLPSLPGTWVRPCGLRT